jgi:5-methylcytosine-specific restriction enzyme A
MKTPKRQSVARDPIYQTAAWRAFRLVVLTERPICEVPGCGAPSRQVDHRMPVRKGGAPFDRANVQPLCLSCHSRKTATNDGGFGNRPNSKPLRAVGSDASGQPLDPTHPWFSGR